jgi:predicted O-methyltransferase YrrM
MKVASIVRRLRNEVRVLTTTRRAPARLRAAEHPWASALAGAIDATVRQDLDSEASAWIDKIDARRNQLLASTELLDPDGLDEWVSDKVIGDAAGGTTHRDWGTLQLMMVRALDPSSCLELGASLGISGAYIAAGMHLAGSGDPALSEGRLVSYEASLARAPLAAATWVALGLDNASVIAERFEPDDACLPEIGPIDFAFLDAHHEPEATVAFTHAVLAHLSPHGVLLFDDIRWSPGMERAWDHLKHGPRVAASIDLGRVGICMYGPDEAAAPVHVAVASRLRGSMITAT